MFTSSQVQTIILGGICSCPTISSGLSDLPLLVVFSYAKPLPFVFGALLAPGTVPPPAAAALELPFSELLLPSSCSPLASFPALLSLSELFPVDHNKSSFYWHSGRTRQEYYLVSPTCICPWEGQLWGGTARYQIYISRTKPGIFSTSNLSTETKRFTRVRNGRKEAAHQAKYRILLNGGKTRPRWTWHITSTRG